MIVILYKLANFLLIGYSFPHKIGAWRQTISYKLPVNLAIFLQLFEKLVFEVLELQITIIKSINLIDDFL